jgi:inner membrane protein
MPTIPTHAVAAVALGTAFPRSVVSSNWLAIGAVCAMLPDADVMGFRFGIQYGDLLGHRGLTHSLAFAALLAAGAIVIGRRVDATSHRGLLWLYVFAATASHGLLDALTNGGLGVALFAPLDETRYFFGVRPIVVSPIGLTRIFSQRGLAVISSELRWIWVPSALLAAVCLSAKRSRAGAKIQGAREDE